MYREATPADVAALCDLEREANMVALAHVFPPDHYPFPDEAVLARWRLVMDDPGAVVIVADSNDGSGLVAFAAYDEETLRHLAVRPDRWGEGLATEAVRIALREMARRGTAVASLWCLERNGRARRLYEHLGWRPTDDRQEAPWPPHPTEMRYTKVVGEPR